MSNRVSQCTDFLQQLSISTDINKSNTVVHMVHNSANNPVRANVHVQHVTSNHQRDRELQTPKKVRRKPRYRNRHKQKDDEENLRHSVSSNCSRSSSSNFRDLLSSPSTSAKKSTNSPRQRIPSASTNTSTGEDTTSVTFCIRAVTTNTNSMFIRQRNIEDRFINLRSFIDSRSYSYLFVTQLFKKSGQKTNKIKCRKYAKKESRRERKKKEQEREQATFSEYLEQKDIDEGLAHGTLVKGFIRINPKNCRESYVNNEDSSIADYCITSITDRNRALEGDQVVLQLIPKKGENSSIQNPAKVVSILQKVCMFLTRAIFGQN